MTFSINFPPLTAQGSAPVWVGNGFRVGEEFHKVLFYSENNAGWDDDLTVFQEEVAGENHFIDKSSRQYTIEQIKKYCQLQKPTILEIGCSSGFLLKQLRQSFPHAVLTGADIVYQPLIQLATVFQDIPLARFDLVNCPLPDNCVDVIVLLNVLEHIENDEKAMQQIQRILKPGGIAILEVPAGPTLYDNYDRIYKHFRRYKLSGLKALVHKNNMKVLSSTHLGFFLYPGFWWVKKRNQRLLNETDVLQRQAIAESITKSGSYSLLNTLMKFELAVGKYVSYPLGIRCLLTCTKPIK